MKRIEKIAIAIFFVAISVSLYGQDAKEELKAVLNTYNSLERFSVDAEYKAYETHTSTEVIDQSIAQFRKDGSLLHTNNMGMEYIQNNKYALAIDHNNEMIVLGKSQKIPKNILGLEESLSNFEKVEKMAETEKTTTYEIHFKKGSSEYTKAVLEVYKNKKLIKTATLFYAADYAVNTTGAPNMQKPRVIITYKNYKTGESFQFKESEFNVDNYFSSMKGDKTLQEKYKGYAFFDKTKE